MTQRARVLQMLQAAGEKGVRSDEFFADYMPRAAARIKELRDEGYEIVSKQERQFVRYKLLGAGVGAGQVACQGDAGADTQYPAHPYKASVDSGRESTGGRGEPEEHTSAPTRQLAANAASGVPARCTCAQRGLGFDSLNPLEAKPCQVHSPEYEDQERTVPSMFDADADWEDAA